jgi:hypothetical protein
MSRTCSIPMLALTWCLAGCPSTGGNDAVPTKVDSDAAKTAQEKKPVATPPGPPPPPPGGGPPMPSEPPSDPGLPATAPPWFRPDAFEHAAVVREDVTGTRIATGQSSAMIVLELPATTTPEQCIERARAKLAETITEPPISSTMPQGHLSLRGKGDGYEYNIVCGIAKEKPTMFLSYIR